MSQDTVPASDASRREFLGKCASAFQLAAVGGILPSLLSSCGQARISTVKREGNRVEANVALLVADGMTAVLDIKGPDGKGIVIIRVAPESYTALSMRCTHKGCEVAPPEGNVIVCPCHDSRFDLTGAVVKPPATEPLKKYVTSYKADSRVVVIELI
ncbi:MAG: Rieske (2Fe-2S) protein [bacterium]|nr:Rieske (2Fe-2S) protein [Candidatus Kapabacteria bacterium]